MQKYKCHKEVQALKIKSIDLDGMVTPEDDCQDMFVVEADIIAKYNPQPGWYYVVYEDGYTAFSPAEAFENGYTAIPCGFIGRMQMELVDLNEKTDKLRAFLHTETYQVIGELPQKLMNKQLKGMEEYFEALEQRLECLKVKD